MILYGLKTCDTCRKARKALADVDFVDVREDGIPVNVLGDAFSRFGEKLLNKRSTTWKNLSDSQRSEEVLPLLQAHPTLMKRPLIVSGDSMWLGWDKSVQAELSDA
ncbi:putative reductase [Pelagimonas phthalicica]|uniref:Putative reductase n=1 Tax=Pelagimonas phthalicica TaxID=1037362 RepID=A0A238JEH0_9RHOB|nr:ArsC/Spx/MgsR family protein [Pelagimonas phthalicica]TDS92008.1 arsenate reductase-like glutaredoxin family protein [Pelagimonas phthalicica]SMX29058.1 putative reductase [Pelagimonas phthalicica]